MEARRDTAGAVATSGGAGVDVEIQRADATTFQIGEEVSGVVLDPPYGRNSQSSYKHIELLRNTLQSARKLVNQSAKMVLIIPIKPNQENQTEYQLLHDDWQTYLELFADLGIKLLGQWKEHVHSSLSRLILLASISPLNLTD